MLGWVLGYLKSCPVKDLLKLPTSCDKKNKWWDTGVVCVSFVYVKVFLEELEEIARCIIWATYNDLRRPHFLLSKGNRLQEKPNSPKN